MMATKGFWSFFLSEPQESLLLLILVDSMKPLLTMNATLGFLVRKVLKSCERF